MTIQRKLLPAGIACALLAGASVAQAEVSANIGVTSNYLWRGVSQSGDEPAVSGGVDYAHESGFFAGIWASSIDFGTTTELTDSNGDTVTVPVDDGSYELDWYLGYGGEVGDFGYSATYNLYSYPELDDANFGEILLDASWNVLGFGLAYTVNSDVDEPGVFVEGDMYYYGSVGFDLGNDWSLGGLIGFYEFDYDGEPGIGDVSYSHYQIDLGKSAGDMGDFTLTVSAAEEEAGDDETKVVLSWGKSF